MRMQTTVPKTQEGGDPGIPTFEEIEREVVRAILTGQTTFPQELLPVLYNILGVTPGEIEEYAPPGTGISPEIPPSSPPPE